MYSVVNDMLTMLMYVPQKYVVPHASIIIKLNAYFNSEHYWFTSDIFTFWADVHLQFYIWNLNKKFETK